MADRALQFPRGSVIAFTTGAYSDFSLGAIIVAIKDCDLPALAQEYVRTYEKRNDWDSADPDGFWAFLVANGHAMPADVQQVHLGDYGAFETEFGVPRGGQ